MIHHYQFIHWDSPFIINIIFALGRRLKKKVWWLQYFFLTPNRSFKGSGIIRDNCCQNHFSLLKKSINLYYINAHSLKVWLFPSFFSTLTPPLMWVKVRCECISSYCLILSFLRLLFYIKNVVLTFIQFLIIFLDWIKFVHYVINVLKINMHNNGIMYTQQFSTSSCKTVL